MNGVTKTLDDWKPGRAIAAVFGDQMTALHVGPHLTCSETDLLAYALRELDEHQAAITLLVAHATKDEAGDLHELMIPGNDATDAILRHAAGEYLDQL